MSEIKRKRSGPLTLTTMLAGAASLSVASCDVPGSPAAGPQAAQSEQVSAFAYSSLEACETANEISDADCKTGYENALKENQENAPRFGSRSDCEETYGDGACEQRQASTSTGGGSFFTPLLTGFVIGRMLDGIGNPYYRGTGLYREGGPYGGGGYSTGWGGRLNRDYASGRMTIGRDGIDPPAAVRQAPPRVQTRTSVVSRGGFGGGRGFGGGYSGG